MTSNIFFKKKNIKLNKLFPQNKFKKNFQVQDINLFIQQKKMKLRFLTQLFIKKKLLIQKPQFVLLLQGWKNRYLII